MLKLKKAGYKVSDICRCLHVKHSSFYARCKAKYKKPINAEQLSLTSAIAHVHQEMEVTYGSRRMLSELRELGFNVGRYNVRRLMQLLRLIAERPKQHRYLTYGSSALLHRIC